MSVSDEIIRLFETTGQSPYPGGMVTPVEHALQTAHRAEAEGGPDVLVIAALVHDIGQLLGRPGGGAEGSGGDGRHEDGGADWLGRSFGPEVTEPVRLHVAAKRYLCATEPDYVATLSPASLLSLEAQGGPMAPAEIIRFESNPYHREAVWLRRCDDAAKVVTFQVPGLEHYRERIDAIARRAAR